MVSYGNHRPTRVKAIFYIKLQLILKIYLHAVSVLEPFLLKTYKNKYEINIKNYIIRTKIKSNRILRKLNLKDSMNFSLKDCKFIKKL